MVNVCVLAGLRVSELIGLKWEGVHTDAITIDERFCRGDWKAPKSEASAATIGVDKWVNWQVLRRSYATWLIQAGAYPKSVQGQMRHASSKPTMDIYAQIVLEAQRQAVAQMTNMINDRVQKARLKPSTLVN